MENCEFNLVKDGAGAGGCVGGKSGDPFIDRSKVRILLCDNDSRSSEEVCELLCKCSYQVTSVKSARQVIDALNAEGPDIDLILSEVDLPMKKGMKMLKYIMRHEDLKRIPVIMMSAQDEVSTVVKCLRLGAADYLVKPLRTNELLNLWTHMWRRRRMLGLAEKNILSYDFDLAASDPSDANTNSTTLFSDDTDDKSRKSVNPDLNLQTDQEVETNNADLERKTIELSEWHPSVPTISDHKSGQFSSFPKKSELKIGESSAFFTYVKSSMYKNIPPSKNSQDIAPYTGDSQPAFRSQEKPNSWIEQVNNASNGHDNGDARVISSPGDEFPSSGSFLDSTSMERSCTPPMSMEFSKCSDEGSSKAHIHPRNGAAHFENLGFALHHPSSYPYYMPQVMMTTPHHMYQKNLSDGQLNSTTSLSPALMPQYNHHQHQHQHHHIQQCSQIPGTQSFPYYHVGLCLQPGQVPPTAAQQWHPSTGGNSSSVTASKPASKVDRREAALIKFRQKRKERCFDKKIRYVNRKKLAERRPRVRGQFVRKVNGVNVDLNGEPSPAELEDEDEEDDEEDDTDAALRGSSSMEDAL